MCPACAQLTKSVGQVGPGEPDRHGPGAEGPQRDRECSNGRLGLRLSPRLDDALTVDRCCGQGKLTLPGPIYIGGRADEDDHRFYTGAIAGLQIFTDGATASDFQCIYQGEKSMLKAAHES